MKQITQQQFDGATIEERDAYLERRDAEERAKAVRGQASSSGGLRPIQGVAAYRALWLAEAQALIRQDPRRIFDIRKLASDVRSKTGVTKPDGSSFSEHTIYLYLVRERNKLVDVFAR